MATATQQPARPNPKRVPAGCPLTPGQLTILGHVGEGLTYGQIAHREGRAVSTIRTQVHEAHKRLGVPNSIQAVIVCARAGWIAIPGQALETEAAQLVAIEHLLKQVVDAVRKRREKTLTGRQRAYLDALEEHWFCSTPRSHTITRQRYDRAFASMLAEAGLSIDPAARGVQHSPGREREQT